MANSVLRSWATSNEPTLLVDPLMTHEQMYAEGPRESELVRGLRRGAAGVSMNVAADRALRAEASGNPEFSALRDQALALQGESARMYAPSVDSFRNIDGIGSAIDWAAGGLGSGLMSTVPSIAAAIPFGRAGAALAGYGQERGEAALAQYSDEKLAEMSVAQRDAAATNKGLINAVLESAVPAGLAKSIFSRTGEGYLANVGKNVVEEGLTEGAQEYVGQRAQQMLDPTRQHDWGGIVDAAAQGAVAGGGMAATMSAPSHLVGSIMDRKAQREAAAAAAVPPDATGGEMTGLPPPDVPPPGGLEDGNKPKAGVVEDIITKSKGAAAYVSDKLDKAKEAYAKGGSAMDFVNSVFGGIGEDIANLAKGPDDASLAGATPEETIQNINVSDLARAQSAQRVAEELMQDEDIPSIFRDRIVNLGGDYSSPVSQNYIHALASGRRLATQMTTALDGLGKLATGAKSKLDEMLNRGSKRSNLQNFNEADIQPLVAELAAKLGPAEAAKAPTLARQLLAVSSRLSFGFDGDFTQGDQHLRNLSEVIDDKTLDMVTELSGSDALRNAVVKTREIPSASSDLRKSAGNSFFESMLVEKNISPSIKNDIARFVDESSMGIKQKNETQRKNTLALLTPVFGTAERAQTVLEYYGNLQREAVARAPLGADDRPSATRPDLEAVQDSPEKVVEFGALTEKDGRSFQYGFRQASNQRPFRKFGRTDAAGLTEGQIARNNTKGASANSDTHLVPYSEFLDEKGVDHKAGVAMVRADIKKRIEDHKAKGNRKEQINELRGELIMFNEMVKAAGEKRALDMYEVLRHGEQSTEDRLDVVQDEDIKKMQVSADKHPDSVLTFLKTNGKTLKLSAISMIKHQGIKRRDSGAITTPTQSTDEEQLFAAIAAVLQRDDIVELQTKLDDKVQIRALEEGAEGRTLKAAAPKLKAKKDWSGKKTPRKPRFAVNPLRQQAEETYADEFDIEYDPEADNTLEVDLDSEPSDEVKLDPEKSIGGYAELIDLYESRIEQAIESMEIGGRSVGANARSADELVAELEALSKEAANRSDAAETDMVAAKETASNSYSKKGSPEWNAYYEAAGKFDFERQRAWEFKQAFERAERALLARERELESDTMTGEGGETAAFASAAEQRENNTPIVRGEADSNAALKPQPTMKTDAILEANPELLTVLNSSGAPKDPSWSMAKTRERLIEAYKALESEELLARRDAIRKRLESKSNANSTIAKRTLELLDQIISNILEKRGTSNRKSTTTGLARLEKLVATDKAVKRDGVYYVTDATATKRVSGTTTDGYTYVNLAKLKEGGLLKALMESPQKLEAIARLGITPEQLAGLFDNVRREASFLRDYEKIRQRQMKVTEGKDAFPRTEDGMYDTKHKDAIRLDAQAMTDALGQTEFAKLAAQSIANKKKGADTSKRKSTRAKKEKASAPTEGKKHTFVGGRTDPKGVIAALNALRNGDTAETVWRTLGWFRGPDGKMRKEIRSPALQRAFIGALHELIRIRDSGSRNVLFAFGNSLAGKNRVRVSDILKEIPEFAAFAPRMEKTYLRLMPASEAGKGTAGYVQYANGDEREIVVSASDTYTEPLFELFGGLDKTLEAIDAQRKEIEDSGVRPTDAEELLKFFRANGTITTTDARVRELWNKGLLTTVMHEFQHAMQASEGLEGGGNPTSAVIAAYGDMDAFIEAQARGDEDAMDQLLDEAMSNLRSSTPDGDVEGAAHELYRNIVGEVEASDVESRLGLTDEEAKATMPDLMDGSRNFVRSLRGPALRTAWSAQKPRGGRPNKNAKKQQEITDELVKMLGAKIKVAFSKFAKGMGSGSYEWDPKLKQHVIEIATNAVDMHGVAMHEALHAFFRALGKDANLRTVRRDLMAAASTPYAMKTLRKLLEKHPEATKQIEDDMEERVAYMFQFWEAGLMPELGQTGTSLFQRLLTMIRELVGLASRDERAVELMTKFREGAFSDMSIAAEVIKDVNAKTLTTKLEAMAPSVVAAGRKLYQAGPDRLRAFSIPVLNTLADQFSSETGQLGFVQRRFKRDGEWQNRLAKILDGTTAVQRRKALDNLQSMLPPTSKLEKALAKYFEDMYDYMDKAGVKRFDPKAKDWVPVNKLGRYFPRAWDSNTIRANRAAWERLLAKNNVSQDQIKKVTDAIVKGDGHIDLAESVGHIGFTPFAAAVQNRQFTFINQSNAAEFAKFQTKELADVVVKYTKQAVHRAEYARSFGNKGETIDAAIKAAKLNPKEKAEVLTVVRGLEGTLDGNGISQDTKAAMSWVMTAQNVVLLPLALFSQMIDPVAIAARSGDLGDAGSAYVTAIKRLFDKNPSHAEKMARMMGIISSDSTLEAMGMSYGSSYMSPGAQKVNRMFFKYNGMQHWNDSMRIAATAAGESYLIDNLKNDAVLKELGLQKGDIAHKKGRILLTAEQFAAKHGGAITQADEERAARVQEAMFRFVDSAVLRPSASQRPTWMSDPRFMLVGHLKQFTFAMHNVILKRAQRELDYNDNVRPSATLMLSVPIILAADLVKMAFTGAPPGWGYTDYIKHAVQRSGILGLGDFGTVLENDVARGKAPGEGLLGPAAEHLLKILRWVFNDPKTSFEDVVDRTIPGARFV